MGSVKMVRYTVRYASQRPRRPSAAPPKSSKTAAFGTCDASPLPCNKQAHLHIAANSQPLVVPFPVIYRPPVKYKASSPVRKYPFALAWLTKEKHIVARVRLKDNLYGSRAKCAV